MRVFLDFEKQIAELENKIEDLRHLSDSGGVNIADEVSKLQSKADRLLRSTYQSLTPWQKVLVARHPKRPHFRDYADALLEEYTPFAGDRNFADDKAIEGGLAKFQGRSCVVVGHEKGANTNDRVHHNFGMARPEGYRKAQRLMTLADRFETTAAHVRRYAGRLSRHRRRTTGSGGSNREMYRRVPVDSCAHYQRRHRRRRLRRRHRPSDREPCRHAGAQHLFGNFTRRMRINPLAQCGQGAGRRGGLRLTAQDLQNLNLIDDVVPEPVGGAHRDPSATIHTLGERIRATLDVLLTLDGDELRERRREKFLAMGKSGLN